MGGEELLFVAGVELTSSELGAHRAGVAVVLQSWTAMLSVRRRISIASVNNWFGVSINPFT
jgi:hypothetical protein